MDRQLNQPTASTSQNTHKKKRQHVSLPNTNPVAGSSSGRTLADNIPNSSRGPLPALGLGLSDSTSAAQNSPPRLRHKRPMPNFGISASNNAGPSAVAGPSKANGKKKEHQPRQFVAAKASSSKQRAAVHGDGDRGLTGSGMVAAHDTEDDTVTGAESMNDTMTSSSGYAGITGELKKMRKELEILKKQVSSGSRTTNEQAKTIQDLKRELSIAAKKTKDQDALIEKLRAESRHAEETMANVESNLQCQICIDTLSKPYSLSPCGHVLCLRCLQEWFRQAPVDPADHMEIDSENEEPLPLIARRKTCPCCRTTVRDRPVRSFVVRGLVEVVKKAKAVKQQQQQQGAAGLSVPGVGRGASSPPPELEGEDPWEGIFEEENSEDESEDENHEDSDVEEDENDMEVATSEDEEMGVDGDEDEEDAQLNRARANAALNGTFGWLFGQALGRQRANAAAGLGEDSEEEGDGASVYVSGSDGGQGHGHGHGHGHDDEETGSEMHEGEDEEHAHDEDEDESQYSDSSDEDYQGTWIAPRWEPPLYHPKSEYVRNLLPQPHPHPHTPHIERLIKLYSRGVTREMVDLHPDHWKYSHREGIVLREFGLEIWLGWNLKLKAGEGGPDDEEEDGDDDGGSGAEKFLRRIWEEMYEGKPERWRREPIFGSRNAVRRRNSAGNGTGETERVIRLVRADKDMDYDTSDSNAEFEDEEMDQ